MKKLSRFKRMKNDAVSFLIEELKMHNFNRFSVEEISSVRGYYPHVDKSFLHELLNFRLLKCLPVKLNFDNFIVDVKIDRRRVKNTITGELNEVCNEVQTSVSLLSKKIETNTYHILSPLEETSFEKKTKSYHKLVDLLDMRVKLIVELDKITAIHNKLCLIFEDDGTQPSILSEPSFCLTEDEIEKING